jgi:hypothetical protein
MANNDFLLFEGNIIMISEQFTYGCDLDDW